MSTPDRQAIDDPDGRFRAFFERNFDAALVIAEDGRIVEANPAACAMFGYALDDLRAHGRGAIVDRNDPRLASLLPDGEGTGDARGRLTMQRGDGSRFEAELSSSAMHDRDGHVHTCVIVRDLTEQIKAEQAARRESLDLARRVEALAVTMSLASAPSLVYRALLDFAMAVSPAEAVIIAERRGDDGPLEDVYAGWVRGGEIEEEIPPSIPSAAHDDATIDAVLGEGRSVVVVDLKAAARRPPEQARRWVFGPPSIDERSRAAVVLPVAALGDIHGIVEFRASTPGALGSEHVGPLRLAANLAAIAVDDLRRHERERQARRRAEAGWQHLREIVDQAPVMMAMAEGPDHVFTGANRRYLETLGLQDIVGKPVRDVFPEIEAQGVIAILDEVYRTGEAFVAEGLPMDLRVNGELTRFHFNLVYQPIRDGDDRVTGILANVADVSGLLRANEALNTANAELREAYDQTIRSWGRALDIWDHDTAGHSQRVTNLAVALGRRLGIAGQALEHLRWGAELHDIGKMGIPDHVLLKPGKLDAEEWELMKTHTTQGAAFLEPISYLRPAIEIPLHHHERWDGAGYPHGLAGEAIPLSARIFAVVDVYDALTSERPYREAWSTQRTLEHIAAGAGTHFDPTVVHAFLELMAGAGEQPGG